MKILPDEPDAYRYARRLQSGCMHQLGCRCGVPYWLRPSSASELELERWLRRPRPRCARPGGDQQ